MDVYLNMQKVSIITTICRVMQACERQKDIALSLEIG